MIEHQAAKHAIESPALQRQRLGQIVTDERDRLGAGLGTLIGFYLLFTARRIEPRPEDLDDADISDGAGELGFFSPYSWAPLWCGLAAATCFLGLVFGWWLFFIGAAFAIPAVGSMVFEYYSDASY